MKTFLKEAVALAQKINKCYNQLTFTNDQTIFNRYHDTLKIQNDCAWEVVGEIEHYERTANDTNAEQITHIIEGEIANLKKALLYCQGVIKLQTQFEKLPEAIFC